MSTHVALVNRGKIVQIGDAEDLYRRPESLFAAHFIGEGSFFEGLCVRASGGHAEIRIGNLRFLCVDADCKAGQRAVVLVRPEDCQIVSSGGTFSGVIATCAFLGSHYEVTASTSFGTVRLHSNTPLRVGEPVQLRISANAGVSFGIDERSTSHVLGPDVMNKG